VVEVDLVHHLEQELQALTLYLVLLKHMVA